MSGHWPPEREYPDFGPGHTPGPTPYRNGCRCRGCRDLHNEANYRWREAHKSNHDGVAHGVTRNRLGCNCEVCAKASHILRLAGKARRKFRDGKGLSSLSPAEAVALATHDPEMYAAARTGDMQRVLAWCYMSVYDRRKLELEQGKQEGGTGEGSAEEGEGTPAGEPASGVRDEPGPEEDPGVDVPDRGRPAGHRSEGAPAWMVISAGDAAGRVAARLESEGF